MFDLDPGLLEQLKEKKVRIDLRDENTLMVWNVPINQGFYNKSRTNVLIKDTSDITPQIAAEDAIGPINLMGSEAGLPWIIGVDADLEYRGGDAFLARAFAAGLENRGWRVLSTFRNRVYSLESAILFALAVLGFNDQEPCLDPPTDPRTEPRNDNDEAVAASVGSLLGSWGKRVSDGMTLGRDDVLDEVLCTVLQAEGRLPVLCADSGVGKTNFIAGMAKRIREKKPSCEVHRIDLCFLMAGIGSAAEREGLLAAVLREVSGANKVVLAIERLEQAFVSPAAPMLFANALEEGAKLIATTSTNIFEKVDQAFRRRLQLIDLPELSPLQTLEILAFVRLRLKKHHRVEIDASLLEVVLDRSRSVQGCLPSKAILLLDAAASRAVVASRSSLQLEDIYLAATGFRNE